MAKFIVEATWTMVAQIPVEADSMQEAKEKILAKTDTPDNGVYLDDSFEVVNVTSE